MESLHHGDTHFSLRKVLGRTPDIESFLSYNFNWVDLEVDEGKHTSLARTDTSPTPSTDVPGGHGTYATTVISIYLG